MPAFLVPVDPGHCLIPLEKAVVLIGRQADCDISLTHSRKISRKHCCIAQVNNKFVVRDLGSTNGVFLNGSRIQKEAEISVGDQLTIGDVRFDVQNEAPMHKKEKPAKKVAESPPAEPSSAPAAAKNRRVPMVPPPSMDIPVAIEDEGQEFEVESTNQHPSLLPRRSRESGIDPTAESDESDDDLPLQLATDH